MVYVPAFLANKVYERGSLENTKTGFRFCFKNRMTPLKISGMREITLDVDDTSYPVEDITALLGGQAVSLESGRLDEPVTFGKGSSLEIEVKSPHLPVGKHTIRISFITNEYGGATLKVSDHVREAGDARPKRRKRAMFAENTDGSGCVKVEGELGGIPLDPDFARLETALRREEPDMVPLFEAEIAVPVQEWFMGREIESAADEVEFYIRAGYDFVPVLPPFFTPRLMRMASSAGGELSESDRERAWLVESEGIIKSEKDVREFPWPAPDEVDFSGFYEIAELLPRKMKTLGMLSPAAVFGNASQSMGLENFSYALYDDAALVETLFEIIGSSYLEIAKRLVEVPRLGAVFMSDDLAHQGGCLVSPEVYRKYVFPWYRRIGEVLDGAGLPFIFHSDGNIIEVLDDLAGCGICAIHPIEPQAMDIVEIKKRYGNTFCIFGNVDLEYTLTRGSTSEVEEQVRRKIRDLAPGGGYGLAASNSVPDYVKPENYRAMVESARRYGKYPIEA